VVGSSLTGYGQLVRNASQGVRVEERRAARDGHDDSDTRSSHASATEPDVRFTLANERTFLAWNRTALALVVAGLGIVQLLPPFPGVPWGRQALGVPLIVLGAGVSVTSYWEWRRNQAALRRGAPLPRSVLPWVLAATIAGIAALSAAVLLVSANR
jgi:putative membrane protein